MSPPNFTVVTPEAVAAIASRHGLSIHEGIPLPSQGIINRVFALGDDFVLRVPRDDSAHIAQALTEAETIPVASTRGVRTASLVAFDDARDLLPVPYLIVERLDGSDLETLAFLPPEPTDVWRDVGRNLSILHHVDEVPLLAHPTPGALAQFGPPRALIRQRVTDGSITDLEATWLQRWLDRLEPQVDTPARNVLIHGDMQMSNILMRPADREFTGLVDWGCARVDDPAADFLAVPIRAVPEMMIGYRSVGIGPANETLEARVLWRRLQLMLAVLPRRDTQGLAWGERPTAWLVDLLGFFASDAEGIWRELAPPSVVA